MYTATGQLFWQCRDTTACSSLTSGHTSVWDQAPPAERVWERLPSHHDTTSYTVQTLGSSLFHRAWSSLVWAYTAYGVTRKSDKLPVMDFLANASQHTTGSSLLADLRTNERLWSSLHQSQGCVVASSKGTASASLTRVVQGLVIDKCPRIVQNKIDGKHRSAKIGHRATSGLVVCSEPPFSAEDTSRS